MSEKKERRRFGVCLIRENAQCPKIATKGSAGYDLYAPAPGTIRSGERMKVELGIKLAIPENHYGQICGRSGLALKNGIMTLGGVIDSDYRGEVSVILLNTGASDFKYEQGDRIAQMVLIKAYTEDAVVLEDLEETGRSEGYGSTGK